MPVDAQLLATAAMFPIAIWLLWRAGEEAQERRQPPRSSTVFRALASVMLIVSTLFGWLWHSRGDDSSSEQTWRDTSLDEWRAQRDAEHEAEREQRAGEHREV
jgi:hypothetical protein